MAQEIERKFLIVNDSWRDNAGPAVFISQGYLGDAKHASVRVRIEGERANINIKGVTLVHQPLYIGGSVDLSVSMARRASQEMVTPFTRSATPPWGLTDQPFGRFCGIPPRRYSTCQGNNHYLRAMP